MYRVDIATGERTLVLTDCGVGPEPAEPGDPAPPPAPQPPPEPPSSAEVWDAVALPAAQLAVNPWLEGVTGLETWLWSAGDFSDRSVTVELRGYRLTASARVTGFRWRMGDGAVYTSAVGGSEEQPAVRHTYETKGDYQVVLEVTWEGSFTFTGHGIAETGSLGQITLSDARPYHVFEIRSVPIG